MEVIFAGNSVCHMLSGKATSRAIRGHLLNTLLPRKVFGTDISISSEDNETGEEDIPTRDELHDIN